MLVLWMVALLSVLALSVTTSQRTTTSLVANELDQARFHAVTDAAVRLVMLEVLSARPILSESEEGPLLPDGRPRRRVLFGTKIEVTLEDETSRLNLNTMSHDEIAWLIQQAQGPEAYDETVAAQLADAILDWRDADDLALPNGAEDPEYAAIGLPYGASDAPFQSLSELKLVLGMTPALYETLQSTLTVVEGARGTNEVFASPLVLSVLRRIDRETAQALKESAAEGVGDPALAVQSWNRGGPWYRIKLRVPAQEGPGGRRMEALVRVTPGARPPFELIWRRYAY